jgi:hypothetical protein
VHIMSNIAKCQGTTISPQDIGITFHGFSRKDLIRIFFFRGDYKTRKRQDQLLKIGPKAGDKVVFSC